MSKTILFVLTSHDALGASGGKTGTWLEELAAAYYVFQDAGHRTALASVRGGAAPIDPASLDAPWLTPAGERFLADAEAMVKLKTTAALEDVDAARFDAVYLVGGAGTAWDFPGNAALKVLVETIDRQKGVVAGVCHGVLGLTGARARNGEPLVKGKQVTGISNAEEVITTYDQLVPVLPESRLVELGALYSAAAEPFGAHVVTDGRLVTGQNPASVPALAAAVIRLFDEQPVAA